MLSSLRSALSLMMVPLTAGEPPLVTLTSSFCWMLSSLMTGCWRFKCCCRPVLWKPFTSVSLSDGCRNTSDPFTGLSAGGSNGCKQVLCSVSSPLVGNSGILRRWNKSCYSLASSNLIPFYLLPLLIPAIFVMCYKCKQLTISHESFRYTLSVNLES